ncbi:MAG: hypothetical protein JSV17_14525 [Candidatus Aminicenantes bacterium]|nr:MAG: hypothetical protein JSV17_14525 [Candidatus Aminicenantes bacterium]
MFIEPKISQQHAENIISTKKWSFPLMSKLFSRISQISPKKLEVLYLPFYLFDVRVEKKIKDKKEGDSPRQNVTLSVDGLLGHAVLFAEDTLDAEKDPDTRTPTCNFAISSTDAAKIALDQYKGILLEHGLRTRSHPRADEISEGRKIYYPFWVGYYQKKKGYDFKALDAVSGEIQGVRMRRVFMRALRELG